MQTLLLENYIYVLLTLHGITFSQNCPLLEFGNFKEDFLEVSENSDINLTFWVNTSACKQSDVKYRIDVSTRTDMNTQEHEGKIVQHGNQCIVVLPISVGCLSPVGPAVFYKKVNRSHVEIEWTWVWKNNDFNNLMTSKKKLKLDVSYPPSVRSLTVDGHEANGTYLLNDGQMVNIFCSFEKGKPASIFHVLDQNGAEINSHKEQLNQSLTVHCEDDWPIISCEGKRSKQNRSVSFLVKCSPQFVNKTIKIARSSAQQTIALHIKAYSSAASKCVLAPLSSYNNIQRYVNCSIRGTPPHLVLSFKLGNENLNIEDWILTYQNEGGSANTTIILSNELENNSSVPDENGKKDLYIVTFTVLPIAVVVAVVVVVVCVFKRSRKHSYGYRNSPDNQMSDSRGFVREKLSNNTAHLMEAKRKEETDKRTFVIRITQRYIFATKARVKSV